MPARFHFAATRTSATVFRALVVLTALAASASFAADKPNIIVILADDFGYGDAQALNPDSAIPTPNLNRLANEGMAFTDAHTPSAVCTPTRYGLVCGRYCWRTQLKKGVLGGYSQPLIDADRQTIADVAKSAGYRTGVVGKWHLGLGWQWQGELPKDIDNFGNAKQPRHVDYSEPIDHGPFSLGFDRTFLIPASLDMTPYVYVTQDRVEELPSGSLNKSPFPAFWRGGEAAPGFKHVDVLDRFVTEASLFITEDSKKPFFLYMPLSAPHKPVIVHPRFEGQTELGPYGDFIVQTDAAVGAILETLDHHNLADNTLVFFTSDNGSFMYREQDDKKDHVDDASRQSYRPERHRANGPLRGTKADVYEAGHRVPLFARWPGHVAAGSQSDHTLSLTDLMATVADVTGGTVSDGMGQDSTSFAPVLLGDVKTLDRPHVINHSAAGMFAVRDGHWKLILGDGSGGREKPRGKPFTKPYQLYNLSSDIGETTNLIDKHPDIAARLEEAAWAVIGDDAPKP